MSAGMGDAVLQLFGSAFRVSTPLVLAALGGYMSERAGIVNIALEGLMIAGGLTAAIVAAAVVASGAAGGAVGPELAPWLGLAAGMLSGGALALVYGFFVIRFRADQIVAGTAINMLAMGLAPFVCKLLYGVTGSTPALPLEARLVTAPAWLAWGAAVMVALWARFTPSGLWARVAGEHPDALAAAGVGVRRVRWAGVLMSGILAGAGGAALSICLASSFSRGMTAGRGFMALAALIFGKWRPLPAAAACLFFGVAEAAQIRLQGVVLWGAEPVPVQIIQILPYLVTVLLIAGWVGRTRAPRALGEPYSGN